jgi:hypothetical protein
MDYELRMRSMQGWDAICQLPDEQGVEYIGSNMLSECAAEPADTPAV